MSYSGSDDSLAVGRAVYLKSVSGEFRKFTVSSLKAHKNIFFLAVEELRSIEEAETYRGEEIFVNKETLKRENDTYFWHELLGLQVYADTGECLGEITRIIPTKANDIYLINQGEKEILIPAVAEVVKEIDLVNSRMTISPLEGLLDLDEI